MPDTAWAYLVVSSQRQDETLIDQEHWARAEATANGWEITRVFSAVSTGKSGVRKLLTQLVSEMHKTPDDRRPQRVLMLRLDRVGRGKLADSLWAMRELEDMGCIIHTRDGGDELLDEPMKELIAAVKLAAAADENRVRREKSVAFHARKRAAGEYASKPPYGFVFLDKHLAPYEPEAAVVRQLFEKRVAGFGYQRLAQLAAAIAPAKIRPNGEFAAFSWGGNTVVSILRNPRYRGTIVSETLWDDVAALRGAIRERPAARWPWPLRGAVRCTCGATLLGEASGREGSRTRYYVCRRFNAHANPRYPHHPAAKMEQQFVELLGCLQDAGAQPKGPDPGQLEALRQRKATLTRERSQVEQRRSKAWELAEDGAIDKADLAARLEHFRSAGDRVADALTIVERELAAAESATRAKINVAAAFAGLPALWPTLPVDLQRDIARSVSAYVGGLWADPRRPGELLHYAATNDDGSPRNVDTLRNVDMAQRKMDDSITKKFIQSITE